MSGGVYFVGRKELLEWLNALCGTELTRVEQTCSGAVACQVLDAVYPFRISMNRVDWTATQQHEFVHNYKLLQQSFTALKITKQIPVNRLIRGRYQDNLEFLQWLKAFYDSHAPSPQPYDAHARRAKGKGGTQYIYNNKKCSETSDYVAVLEKMENMKIKSEELTEEKEALVAHVRELREAIERTKKERDFYLKKLEAIGELVHDVELSKTTSAQTNFLGLSILDVLYATEEDEQEQEMPF